MSSTTAVVFPFPNARFSPALDVAWTINRMDIPMGAYSISGQPLTFAGTAPQIRGGIGHNVISARLVLTGPMTIIGGFSGSVTLTGGIDGVGPLTIEPYFATITGLNTFTGGLSVTPVTALAMNGTMVSPITVAGDLLGTGNAIAGVTVTPSGRFFPGQLGSGAFTAAGVVLDGSAGFNVSGPAAGTQYTFLNVNGPVALGGGRLSLFGSYVPVRGDVFTIIVNDGTDPVAGTFNNLAEGATVALNGVPLRISYVGGTGNDVTLTALVTGAAAAIPTLSEWGLLLLATILLGVGMRSLRTREIRR